MTFNEFLDFEVHEMNSEVVEMRTKIRPEFANEMGALHGAIIMALADVATGFLAIDFKYMAPTLSSYTNFLRAVIDSEYLYARAEVVKRGSRTVTIDCEIWDDSKKTVAINRSDFVVIDDSLEENPSPYLKSIKEGNYRTY